MEKFGIESIVDLEEVYANREINKERLIAILQHAGSSILDVGCGNGSYIFQLAQKYQITGVDYQPFASWNKMPQAFSICDATDLSIYKSNSFDTVTCFETLEHLTNPDKALQEFHRVCRENIILTVPNCEVPEAMLRSELIYKTWIDRTHVQFFTMSSVIKLVEKNGFNVTRSCYINKINLYPFLEEAFNLSGRVGGLLKKILMKRKSKDYHITCLLVAEKS